MDIEDDVRKQEVRRLWSLDGNVRVDSLAGGTAPQENRGHYGLGNGLQRQRNYSVLAVRLRD